MIASPIVTAIIPCRNHARYVPQRLASVLGQTMPRLEVLFLDDDSTDGSYEAAAAFAADPRLTLRRQEPPAGNPFAAWRAGASFVLHKPFDLFELLKLVQAALGEAPPARRAASAPPLPAAPPSRLRRLASPAQAA